MAQALEDSTPSDETKQQEKRKWQSDQAAVARIVSTLLQKGWLTPVGFTVCFSVTFYCNFSVDTPHASHQPVQQLSIFPPSLLIF